MKPDAVVRTDRVKRYAIVLAPVLLAWLLVTFMRPLPVEAGLYRLFDPFGHVLPAALSEVAVKPGDVTIAQGDDLDITAKVSAALADRNKSIDRADLAVGTRAARTRRERWRAGSRGSLRRS